MCFHDNQSDWGKHIPTQWSGVLWFVDITIRQNQQPFGHYFSHFKNHQNLWSDFHTNKVRSGVEYHILPNAWFGVVEQVKCQKVEISPTSHCRYLGRVLIAALPIAHLSLSEWSPLQAHIFTKKNAKIVEGLSHGGGHLWRHLCSLQIRRYLTTSQDGHLLISHWLVDVTSRLIISLRMILWSRRRAFHRGGQLR